MTEREYVRLSEAIAFLEKSKNPGDRVYRDSDDHYNPRRIIKMANGEIQIEYIAKVPDKTTPPADFNESWWKFSQLATPPDNWYIVRAPRFKKGEIVFHTEKNRLYFYDSPDPENQKWAFVLVDKAITSEKIKFTDNLLISVAEYNEKYLGGGEL